MNNKTLLTFLVTCAVFVSSTIPCFALEIEGLEDYDSLFFLQPEKKISLDFTNADLNTVLKMFSQQSGLNFIAATDVADKKVNLYLDQVPVEEALERILSANGLTYEIKPDSNIFVVNELKTSDKQFMTRVYPLRFATVPSSKLNQTLSIEGGKSSSSESAGILAAVKSVLTGDGSVIEDIRTNSLIVNDIPSQFPLIEQTIARLDVRIPQILIEAEMLDISKRTADLLGAKFGDTPLEFSGASRDVLVPFDRNKALQNYGKSGGQGYQFSGEFTAGTLSFAGLTVTLQFLRTQADTKNLARPRILTLNNDTAEISIKTDEAIGLDTSSSADTGTTSVEAERVETGVFLKVTPQANIYTREITMAIEPKVSVAKQGQSFGGVPFKDPEERSTKSLLRVKDGDTIVIGGLLRSEVAQTKTQVPILGNIPVLGAAFRHKDSFDDQRELIVFITPHILDEEINNIVSSKNQDILREQSVPTHKNQMIERELSSIEEQKFSSYR
ncbi:MAG: secretin and TonB N-terminal domain-containing protein [Candidatus Omnitrophica bacterium]|nr:secretin and TonB N-terminal domain-containing protein [Candidatus Omnitrophota bacterium]